MNRLSIILFTLMVSIHYPFSLLAQESTVVLVLSNKAGKVILDGDEKGECQGNIPFKLVTAPGEHYVQVRFIENGRIQDKGEILNLDEGKQKILKLTFEETVPTIPSAETLVAELNFTIPGLTTVALWTDANPKQQYSYPAHMIAFEKGDEIILNTSMTNKKGTNVLEVRTYPGNVLKYSNKSFAELENIRIRVEERSIYQLTFATNHIFDRNCLLTVKRKSASAETALFNTNVSKQRILRPTSVVEPVPQFVNGGTNATFMGGKSRIIIPVTLPENTVEWFYRFSASRSKEDIENVRNKFRLFGELTELLLTAIDASTLASKAVSIGVDQLTLPPGSDHCDVFLLSYENILNFESKNDGAWRYILEGSRENLKSGNVKVTCCNQGQFYLGIKNPANIDGINVSVEVIAITASEEYVMEGNK